MIIIIKTSSTGPNEKNKVFSRIGVELHSEKNNVFPTWEKYTPIVLEVYPKCLGGCFRSPPSTCATKTEENTTQESNQRLTAPLNPSSVPVSNTVLEGHFIHLNLSWQERPSKLGRSTPRYFKLQWISCAAARVCWTLVEADGSSLSVCRTDSDWSTN